MPKLKGRGKFIVFTQERTFTFFTVDYKERDIWIQSFCRIIDINTGRASDGPSMKEARSFFSMRGYGYESDKGVLVAIGGNVPQTQINNDYDEYDEYFEYYENDKDHATSGFSNTVEVGQHL